MLASDLHVQKKLGGDDDGSSCSSRLKVPCRDQSTNNNQGTLLHLNLEHFSAASTYSSNNPLISSRELSRRHPNSTYNPSICTSMHTIISTVNPSSSSSDSPVMSSNDTSSSVGGSGSSRVPFKWEEAPGKPITSSSSNELMISTYTTPSCLQLPPRLQGPPLFFDHSPSQSPSRLHHPINHQQKIALNQPINQRNSLNPPTNQIPLRLNSNHPKLKNLCKFLLKTASWSQPLHKPAHAYSQSWSSSSPATKYRNRAHDHHDHDQQDDLAINHRFFFDKSSPKDLKYSVSMDSSSCRKPALPLYQDYRRQDEFVSKEALSFLAMEEEELHEADLSTASSPWQPVSFHDERKGCGCSPKWPPITTNMMVHKRLEDDEDEDEDEGFHDFFSNSSLEKPSQRTDDSIDSVCSSPCPWYLQFGPEEEEVHVERSGRKLVVRLVALVKLKRIISSKVSKFRKRREGTNPQVDTSSMWSPTLATYLYNQQREERESLDHPTLEEEEEEEEEDVHSNSSSNRLHIDPNYYLPSSIMRHYSPNCSFSEEEKYPSHAASNTGEIFVADATTIPYNFSQDKEEEEKEEENEPPPQLTNKLRLREQLAEFEVEYPVHFLHPTSTIFSSEHPQEVLDIKRREATPYRRLCKVQKKVKMLAATIKLILVQTEVRKRKGLQRPSLKYGSCINPMVSPSHSTHK